MTPHLLCPLVAVLLLATACTDPAPVNQLDPDTPVVDLGVAPLDAGADPAGGAVESTDPADPPATPAQPGVVPDVTGDSVPVAEAVLESLDLQVEAAPLMARISRAGDIVFDTIPAAGESIPPDGRVVVRTTVPMDFDQQASPEAAARVIAVHPLRFGRLDHRAVVDVMAMLCEDVLIDDDGVSLPEFNTRAWWYGVGGPTGVGPALADLLRDTVVTESNAAVVLDETLMLLQLSAAPLCPSAAEGLLTAAGARAALPHAPRYLADQQPPRLDPLPADQPADTRRTGVLNPSDPDLQRLLDDLGVPPGTDLGRELRGSLVSSAATACENIGPGQDDDLFLSTGDLRIDEDAFVAVVSDVWCTADLPAAVPNAARPRLRAVVDEVERMLGPEQAASLRQVLGLTLPAADVPATADQLTGSLSWEAAPGGRVGSPIGAVLSTIEDALGAPDGHCTGRQGRHVTHRWGGPGGLEVYEEAGTAIGWALGAEAPAGIVHVDGLRIGVTRDELTASYGEVVEHAVAALDLGGSAVPTLAFLSAGEVAAIGAADRAVDTC